MTGVRADRLDRDHAAYGVSVPPMPKHLTIYQAEGLIADLKAAVREARRLNDEAREV